MDDRVAKLLLKAVRTLSQREQDQVFTALFREALSEPVPFTGPPPTPAPHDVLMLSQPPSMQLPPGMGASGQTAMLPVRLPPELHERLRRWSTDQGFSMASVVRGLVERFLDEQSSRKPGKRPAARPGPKKKGATARG
jgi:hypothetical protein